jgi:WD40 repeat protein
MAETQRRRTIYVSSTFEDLKEHRAAVKLALERAGYDVESMERYAAFSEPPLDRCLADVAVCDAYVLVLAHRYGFRPLGADGAPGPSITQREYEAAVAAGKAVLSFLIEEEQPWPPRFVEKGAGAELLDTFRQRVQTSHGVRFFTTPDNLAQQVLAALSSHELRSGSSSSYRWPDPINFEPFIEQKRESFEGREWLFQDIDGWLADAAASRALLIRADFGVGKSALLAEYIARHRTAANASPVLAWHCCQHDTQETLQPGAFVRHLAALLAQALPAYRAEIEANVDLQERLDRALVDPGTAFERAVLGPLAKLDAPAAPRLLVIDALDEALELDAEAARKTGSLVDLLADKAGRFPHWLRVLATSRPNPEVIAPLQQAFSLTDIDAEGAGNTDDLRCFVRARLCRAALAQRVADAGQTANGLADLLVAKSGGKFLFAVRALRDFEAGNLAVDEFAALPAGMDAFYRDAFHRRFERVGRDYAPTRDLLGVICAAREPMGRAELAEVLGITQAALQDLHRALPDFLRLRNQRLAFDHFSLAEWLTREDDEGFARAGPWRVDLPVAQRRLHDWALVRVQAGDAHTSPYLLRHLASHLPEAAERCAVFAQLMLERFEWSWARLQGGGPQALLADAGQMAGHPEQALLLVLLRNSAHVLRRHPGQWPMQVLGRVGLEGLGGSLALAPLAQAAQGWLHTPAGRAVGASLLQPLQRSLPMRMAVEQVVEGGAPLVVLPAGRLACASGSKVRVWNPAQPDQVVVLEGHTNSVWALAVLPDGRIASGSEDATVRVWNPAQPGQVLVLEGHTNSVQALAVLPDGRIASGSRDNTVRVWSPAQPGQVLVLEGHTLSVQALAVLPDGRIASGSWDRTVRVWSPAQPGQVLVLEGHTNSVQALAVLPDGRIASGSWDRTVRVWSPAQSGQVLVLEGHTDSVQALAVLPDGRIASGSWDRTVRVWNPAQPGQVLVFEGHTDPVWALAVLPDGRIASRSGDNTVRVWNPAQPGQVLVLEGLTRSVGALAVLPDGRIASGSKDGTLRVWDSRTGRPLRLFVTDAPVTCIAVRPDGLIAVGCSDGGVHFLRDADTI